MKITRLINIPYVGSVECGNLSFEDYLVITYCKTSGERYSDIIKKGALQKDIYAVCLKLIEEAGDGPIFRVVSKVNALCNAADNYMELRLKQLYERHGWTNKDIVNDCFYKVKQVRKEGRRITIEYPLRYNGRTFVPDMPLP